jgi:hypothetical protein
VSIVSPYNDRYMSNLTIMFNTSGAGVQVSCEYGMLHVKFSAPPVMFVSRNFTENFISNNIMIKNKCFLSTKPKDYLAIGITKKMTSLERLEVM